MRYILPLLLILSLLITACQPETEIIRVPDNDVVPDKTVPEVIQENYINKLYIGLLGRKPSTTELQQNLNTLDQNNAALADRKKVIESILSKEDYTRRMFDIARAEMLNNIDTTEIVFQISLFNSLTQDPQYEPFLVYLYAEIDKMVQLRNLPKDLRTGAASRAEMHRRMAFNYFYDEINMGSQNFILSVFEYFLGRYPTVAEEEAAILMVDGFGSVLFGMEGNSKTDFLDVFLNSTDYHEGQVIDVYNDFLLREPTSTEMADAVLVYSLQNDYGKMLMEVLSQDEVLGI